MTGKEIRKVEEVTELKRGTLMGRMEAKRRFGDYSQEMIGHVIKIVNTLSES
jgi:hypothetical protein